MYTFAEAVESIVGSRPAGRGKNVMVRCPVHEDRDPSLSVNLDNGLWICFGCGAKGNIIGLAERFGVTLDDDAIALSRARSLDLPEPSVDFADRGKELAASLFLHRPQVIVDYINGRSLSPLTVRHFSMGYDHGKNAVAMPYWDGDVVTGIKYRTGDGKKFSEPGSHYGIYNVDNVRQKPIVVLCEGESDTHAAWSALTSMGISGTIVREVGVGGLSGASISPERWEVLSVDLLWAKKVIVIFDNDEAGHRGASIAVQAIGQRATTLTPTRGTDLSDHLMSGGTLKEIGLLDELAKYPVAE